MSFHKRVISYLVVISILSTLSAIAEDPVKRAENTVKKIDFTSPSFQDMIKKAKDKVFPAVVFIKVVKEELRGGVASAMKVSGSGVIISSDGEVLSNWHVINKATKIRCLLFDGTPYDAELIGSDKDTDLALLKLKLDDPQKKLQFAEIGDSSKLIEGDFVMAMGAPWGLSRSVSVGIISCTKRYLPWTGAYSLWLQTDAAISPGNSGGPLVNTDGKVIGVNTLGVMMGGNMGFAIPAETILQVVPRIRKYGKANWSWTGLMLQPLKDFNQNIYFDEKTGVIVAGTEQGSPASKSGILLRDRIVEIAGIAVTAVTEEDLPAIGRILGTLPVGKASNIKLVRDGKEITLELTAKSKGKVEGDEFACPRWDLTVKSINKFDNQELYFYREKGVFIYGVKRPGNAAIAGLFENDIIIKVGDEEIRFLEDIKRIHKETVENIQKEPRVLITVLRNGLLRQAVLDMSHNFEN